MTSQYTKEYSTLVPILHHSYWTLRATFDLFSFPIWWHNADLDMLIFNELIHNFDLSLQGKMDFALSMIEKAIMANPSYAEAYNNLGKLSQ